jgi:hypothetical protein
MNSKPSLSNLEPVKSGALVVSIQRARRILGSVAKSMNDDQVRELINFLHLLAKEQLVYTGSKDVKYELRISDNS